MSHTTPDTAASEASTASPALPAASLPLETRAGLGSGQNFWQTKEADGVPSFTLTDGPHGLRKQEGSSDHLGLAGSVKATCFPPAAGLSQSWDPELVEKVGAALAEEAQAADVQVLLGPGVNIKSPRWVDATSSTTPRTRMSPGCSAPPGSVACRAVGSVRR